MVLLLTHLLTTTIMNSSRLPGSPVPVPVPQKCQIHIMVLRVNHTVTMLARLEGMMLPILICSFQKTHDVAHSISITEDNASGLRPGFRKRQHSVRHSDHLAYRLLTIDDRNHMPVTSSPHPLLNLALDLYRSNQEMTNSARQVLMMFDVHYGHKLLRQKRMSNPSVCVFAINSKQPQA